MSEMVERVAKALMFEGYRAVTPGSEKTADEVWGDLAEDHNREAARRRARAALLAALDLSEAEQQQLFEDDADHDGRVHNESVRATLQKLKAFAQGGSVE